MALYSWKLIHYSSNPLLTSLNRIQVLEVESSIPSLITLITTTETQN